MNIEYTSRLEKIESVLLQQLPRSIDTTWIDSTFYTLPQAIRPSHITNLTEPAIELLLRGGKRWRPLLMVLSCELAGGEDRAYPLVPIVEFSHTASLIHDDIEDHADQRRGKPAIHIMFGEDASINCGSWLYFHAFSTIDFFPASGSVKLLLYKITMRNLRKLHLGQAMDIAWHNNPSFIPVKAEYEAMVTMKTGTLSRLAAELGMIVGGKTEGEASDFGDIAARIGLGFQVIDDVLNLTTGNPGKKRGDDIVEGKKSLPVLLHLEQNPKDLDFFANSFSIARKEGINSPKVEEMITKLNESNSIKKAKEYGISLIEQSCCTIRGRYKGVVEAELIANLFEEMISNLN